MQNPTAVEVGNSPPLFSFYLTVFTLCSGSPSMTSRKHVYQDLRPYICLEESCTTEDQAFRSRRDWNRHMLANHWKEWNCPLGCSASFQSSYDLRMHSLKKHIGLVSPENVDTLVALSSTAGLTMAEGRCSLCRSFDIKSSRMYASHVGHHLEQLALFVLPQTQEDETNGGDADGVPGELANEADDVYLLEEQTASAISEGEKHFSDKSLGFTMMFPGTAAVDTVTDDKLELVQVWGCCYCGHGSMNIKTISFCIQCSHVQCRNCWVETCRVSSRW